MNLISCHCDGQHVSFNEITKTLETLKDPLVKELYGWLPEFDKVAGHANDELPYVVYGELSSRLFDDIVHSDHVSDFTRQCFRCFNALANRQDEAIDTLLVVGVYERLYARKKCNEVARQLLTGRNKELYELSMRNGSIRADY